MCAMRNNKRNSLPSLTMNKFFVNKRASMFEKQEEAAPPPGKRDWREWSPCGLVETSQRKMAGVGMEEEEKVECGVCHSACLVLMCFFTLICACQILMIDTHLIIQ